VGRERALGSYSGKFGTYPGKFENIRANLKMKTSLISCEKGGKF